MKAMTNKTWKRIVAFTMALTIMCGEASAMGNRAEGGLFTVAAAETAEEPFVILPCENGTIQAQLVEGSDQEFNAILVTATPAAGYKLDKVFANGEQVAINDQGEYLIAYTGETVTLSAEFAAEETEAETLTATLDAFDTAIVGSGNAVAEAPKFGTFNQGVSFVVAEKAPALTSFALVSDSSSGVGTILTTFSKDALGFFGKTAATNVTNRLLNLGLDKLFAEVFGNGDISNEKLQKHMDEQFDKLSQKMVAIASTLKEFRSETEKYHNEDIKYFDKISAEINSLGFKEAIDQINSDTRGSLNLMEQYASSINPKEGEPLDTDTRTAYKRIANASDTSCEKLETHFSNMVAFIKGENYQSNHISGYDVYVNSIIKSVEAADRKHTWNDAVDYNAAFDAAETEIRCMQHDLLVHYYLAMATRYMQYQLDVDKGLKDAKNTYDIYQKQMSDYLGEANECFNKAIEKLEAQKKQYVQCSVTCNGVTKGYKNFAQAWSCATTCGADAEIKLESNGTTDVSSLDYSGLSNASDGGASAIFSNNTKHTITVNLNGGTLRKKSDGRVFGATDSCIRIKNGTVSGGWNLFVGWGNVSLELENVNVKNMRDASILYQGSGKLKMNDCNITGGVESVRLGFQAGIHVDAEFNNCTFKKSSAESIYVHEGSSGTMTMNNCYVGDTGSTGIYVKWDCNNFTVNMNHTTVNNCGCSGIISYANNTFNIDSCHFEGNKQEGWRFGGAICTIDYDAEKFGNPRLNIKNSNFIKNECRLAKSNYRTSSKSSVYKWGVYNRSAGGAICARDLNIDHCTFDSNVAPGFGGAVYVPCFPGTHHVDITNCYFKDNDAPLTYYAGNGSVYRDGNGGAILTQKTGWGNIRDNVFVHNTRDYRYGSSYTKTEISHIVYQDYDIPSSGNEFYNDENAAKNSSKLGNVGSTID